MQRLGALTCSVKVCGKQTIRHVHVNQMRLFTEDNDFTQQCEVQSQLQPKPMSPPSLCPMQPEESELSNEHLDIPQVESQGKPGISGSEQKAESLPLPEAHAPSGS